MKLALVFVALMLMLMVFASAENAKINGFSVSFNLNKPMTLLLTMGMASTARRQLGLLMAISSLKIYRYPKALPVNSTWINDNLIGLQSKAGLPTEQIEIDKNPGIFAVSMSRDTGKPYTMHTIILT